MQGKSKAQLFSLWLCVKLYQSFTDYKTNFDILPLTINFKNYTIIIN